jgi:hypothetical protein
MMSDYPESGENLTNSNHEDEEFYAAGSIHLLTVTEFSFRIFAA